MDNSVVQHLKEAQDNLGLAPIGKKEWCAIQHLISAIGIQERNISTLEQRINTKQEVFNPHHLPPKF